MQRDAVRIITVLSSLPPSQMVQVGIAHGCCHNKDCSSVPKQLLKQLSLSHKTVNSMQAFDLAAILRVSPRLPIALLINICRDTARVLAILIITTPYSKKCTYSFIRFEKPHQTSCAFSLSCSNTTIRWLWPAEPLQRVSTLLCRSLTW